MISKTAQNKFSIKKLSVDHTPKLKNEAIRIKKFGGVVEPFYDENGEVYGPLRVWAVPQSHPGLAMSRSIGDLVAKKVGVIWNPGTFFFL